MEDRVDEAFLDELEAEIAEERAWLADPDAFLGKLWSVETLEEREWITHYRLTHGIEEPVLEAFQASAVPSSFGVKLLALLLHQPVSEIESLWPRLIALPGVLDCSFFTNSDSECFFELSDSTREKLLVRLWRDDRQKYRLLSSRAAEYCADRAGELEWRIEEIYHLLVADPDFGLDALNETAWEWLRKVRLSDIWHLAKRVGEHAVAGRLTRKAEGWVGFWQGIALIADQEFEAAMSTLEKSLSIFRDTGEHSGELECVRIIKEMKEM